MKATGQAHMNKLQGLLPRTRWQGWTIVERDGGKLVLDGAYDPVPFIWTRKQDAIECKEENHKVVRCEVRVVK